MPYNINRYNGTLLTTVEDGTVDTTLDIKLIGKNYAGYGEVQNENFVHLLENFAGTGEPAKRTTGQVWYDSANKKLKFYDGTKFRTTGGAEVGTTEPVGLTTGDFWFNTSTNQLYAWDGGEFILVGPQAVADAETTQLRSRSVVDTASATHAIVEAVIDGSTVYVISSDEFTLNNSLNPITGFSVIKKGITLINTPNVTGGVEVAGVTSSDHRFWGTSSNALKLGGVDASLFTRKDVSEYPSAIQRFADIGYTVGNDNDLRVYIDGTTPTIQNDLSDSIVFKTTLSGTKIPLRLVGADLLPGVNNTSNIGSSALRYATIFATSFNGTATQSDTLNVGGTYRTASTASSVNTIAARDGSGNIYANRFEGVASEAEYADLAEKYLTDAEYTVGTVVTVGGEKEVRASVFGDRAIGVISAAPAYLMNSKADGQPVALKGRVPVRVVGSIKKGDRLVASDNGCAIHASFHQFADVFGIALESNNDVAEKLVEAVIL
jgi:hypothetical protein